MELRWFDLETRSPDEAGADEQDAVAGWYAEHFGAVPSIGAVVSDLDGAVAELRAAGTTVTDPVVGDEGRSAVATGPAGMRVELVQATTTEEQERPIAAFIATAAPLAGPPTEELLDGVLGVVADAWSRIDALLDGVAHNKVLATMLLAGQRARSPEVRPDSPAFWQRSAASTLLSGFVGRGAPTAEQP
jgi:hypothetical protein